MNYAIKGKDDKTYNIKKIEVQNIKSLSENAIKILKILSEKEMYPKQIAQLSTNFCGFIAAMRANLTIPRINQLSIQH